MDSHKQKLLEGLKKTIVFVQEKIQLEKEKVKTLANKSLREIKSLAIEDQAVHMNLKAQSEQRVEELEHLYSSPFFVKLTLELSGNKGTREVYLAKHHFTQEQIYSWVAPIASVRFETPGPVEYRLPGGIREKAILKHKEQYLIVQGKPVFFAQESVGTPRELIYQEHFSAKKDGFVLPEIVAVMEKAQDAVIRAHHNGPFIISGPAGSGKTTLALHRVAYLVQSPDTSHLYPENSITVFVQDNGTKEYFSHLLPELGIHNVHITTFFEWTTTLLGLSHAVYADRRGRDEADKDQKEIERLGMLASKEIPSWSAAQKFLIKHAKTGLDRIDLTLALAAHHAHYGRFEIRTKYVSAERDGSFKEKTRKIVPQYSLVVVDEFQNYMPEQLRLINSCVDEATKSVIYVGDMAQQVLPGTIRSWDSIGHTMIQDREVRLHKVYRNTRPILSYIRSLGYSVEIPEGIKQGKEVQERVLVSEKEISEYVQGLIDSTKGIIGIIARGAKDLVLLREKYQNNERIRLMTMAESQGVEFDTVCIIGITKEMYSTAHLVALPTEFVEEKKRIARDLLYVALTRAIGELHIIGSCTLKDALDSK
jgi:DNA helicase IV